jgi:Flp pilus assembly protein TadG
LRPNRPCRPLQRLVQAFVAARSGAVTILFAFAATGIVLIVGLALDYGQALTRKAALNAAADAAALAALGSISSDYARNVVDSTMIANAQAAAQRAFTANAGAAYDNLTGAPTIHVQRSGQVVTASVGYQARSPNLFGGLANVAFMNIDHSSGRESVAALTLPSYLDFYLLLDNTPSMGIGATQTDIDNLISLTGNLKKKISGKTYNNPNEASCGFACHETHPCSAPSPPGDCGSTASSKENYEKNIFSPYLDYLNLARKNNITLRIDLLRAATLNLLDMASANEGANGIANQYQFAVYSFGASATVAQTNAIAAVAPLNADTAAIKTQVQALDLMSVDYQGQYNDQTTSFDTAVPALNAIIPTPGDGSSASSRKKYVILITDGLTDENLNGSRTIKPIDPALCTAIKNRGIQIATLYTTYYPLPTNSFYNAYVKPYQTPTDQIGVAVQACASSPDLYAAVGVGGDVSGALNSIFQKLIVHGHLIQ